MCGHKVVKVLELMVQLTSLFSVVSVKGKSTLMSIAVLKYVDYFVTYTNVMFLYTFLVSDFRILRCRRVSCFIIHVSQQ